MTRNRLFVLFGAIGLGLTAGILALSREEAAPVPAPERIVEKVVINSVDVLVVKSEIPPAGTVEMDNLDWQQWPVDAARGLVTRAERPQAMSEFVGSVVRSGLAAGEPLRPEKLLDKGSRFMSTMLAPGKRALAIAVDQAGSMTAGGFVLPNDYVDVIRIEQGAQRVSAGQIVLRNIRVLAVGPNVGEKAGEKIVLGQTATLELDPDQAEYLAAATQGASIILALRGISESGAKVSPNTPTVPPRTVIRAGVPTSF